MKVATWNVNGLRARQAQVAEWIAAERPDVLCLQEIKAKPEQVPEACRIPGYHVCFHGAGGYSGVALYVSEALAADAPRFSHPDFDFETRIVQAELGNLVLASVYVPNGGKDYDAKIAFVERMIGWASELQAAGRELILCGDINITRHESDVHPKERKPELIGQRPEERTLFARLLRAGLVDVGRSLDPENDALFTWWAPWRNMRARNIGWRIDYVLASAAIAARARCSAVLPGFGTSDHAIVVAEFSAD